MSNPQPDSQHDSQHDFITIGCADCDHRWTIEAYCGDRTCFKCRRKRFARLYPEIVKKVSGWRQVYSLTLTIVNIPDSYFERGDVDRILNYYQRFLDRKPFDRIIKSWVRIIHGSNTGNGWNLHIHILYDGSYLPKPQIKKAWREITHGSHIVDICLQREPERAVRYLLSEFLGEGKVDKETGEKKVRIRECDREKYNEVFKGVRLVQCGGKSGGLDARHRRCCPECGSPRIMPIWASEWYMKDIAGSLEAWEFA